MRTLIALTIGLVSTCSIFSQNTKVDNGSFQRLILQKSTSGSAERILVTLESKKKELVVQAYDNTSDFESISLKWNQNEAVMDTYKDNLWAVKDDSIYTYSLVSGKLIHQIALPKQAKSISAIEIGFGGVPFITDRQTQELFVFNEGKWEVLISGASLGKPTVLQRIYGTLFIGTENDLRKFNLKTRSVSIVAKNTGYIKKITLDHFGYLLLLTDNFQHLLRVDLHGNQRLVEIDLNHISDIEFNPDSKKLYAIDSISNSVKLLDDYSAFQSKENYTKERIMKPFEHNGYMLSGSENLIHTIENSIESKQVLTVLQGFYPEKNVVYQGEIIPETARKKLIECAEKSFKALKEWLKNPPQELAELSAQGIPPLFWLMANDYSSIAEDLIKPQRPAQLWYWKRDPAVVGRVPGYWKWEAVLTKDCKCEIPKDEDIKIYLKEYLSTIKKL